MNRSGQEFCGVCVGVGKGVEGFLGGDEAGVLYICVVVIRSRKVSSWRSDNALCNVSSGRIGGTPPKPSRATGVVQAKNELNNENTRDVKGS